MFGRFFQCCNTHHDGTGSELKVVQLSCDDMEGHMVQPVHLLTSHDSFDATLSPRSSLRPGGRSWVSPVTPRERSFKDRIRLPKMRRYPVPPGCSSDDPEELRREELLQTYQEFVLDLHKGMYLTQLSSNQEYCDIHCQLLEDMQTLKVDQGSGCIIEFPLTAVSKVYRIVKNDDKWYSAGSLNGPAPVPPLPLSNAEHIVVVEFLRRKLAFVFNEMAAAQRFLMCVELLIRRAQESRNEAEGLVWRSGRTRGEANAVEPMFSGYSPGHGDRRGGPSAQQGRADGAQLCACQPDPI